MLPQVKEIHYERNIVIPTFIYSPWCSKKKKKKKKKTLWMNLGTTPGATKLHGKDSPNLTYNNFNFLTQSIFYRTKSTPGGQTGPVNSICQLKLLFDGVSSYHTNLFRYHSHQDKQRATIASSDNHLFFCSSNLNKILYLHVSIQEHDLFSFCTSSSGSCINFTKRRSLGLVLCLDRDLKT